MIADPQKKRWVFLETPKTGSTSALTSLKEAGGQSISAQHTLLSELRYPLDQFPLRACTIRNPYDRAISIWWHINRMRRQHGEQSLYHFLRHLERASKPITRLMKYPQWRWAKECNFLLSFENLEEDWREFTEKAGLGPIELQKKNIGKRTHGRDWRTYYEECPVALDMVESIWGADFHHLGFSKFTL